MQIGQRNYVISQGNSQGGNVAGPVACNLSPSTAPDGEADAVENSSLTVSAQIPLGKCPVYAVQTPDSRRLFVLNRGDDTVTVINSQNNTLNTCTPFRQSDRGRPSPAIRFCHFHSEQSKLRASPLPMGPAA